MSTVGENILRMRKKLGWTQEELALKMGYKSKSTINKIEMGKNDIPQSKILQFAEALGTTPAYLMGWEEDKKETASDDIELTEGERILIELFRKLPDEAQKMYLEVLRTSLKSQS
jgi:transcriptional regulator with XRE-family HTH domain